MANRQEKGGLFAFGDGMGQTKAELETQLSEVQTALTELLESGQAWERGERSKTEARLEALQAREAKLLKRLDRFDRKGIRARRVVPRG